MGVLDVFRPNQNEKTDCAVMTVEGSFLTPAMGKSDAEAYAVRAVAGRMPQHAGLVEAYVVGITPLARIRDKNIEDVSIERTDGTSQGVGARSVPDGGEVCKRCLGVGFLPDQSDCKLCNGRGYFRDPASQLMSDNEAHKNL